MTYVVLSNHRFYEKDMIVSLETKKILLRLVLLISSGSYRKILGTRPQWSRDGESLDVIHAIITLKKETKRKIAIELLSAAVSAALLRLIP